MQQAQNDNVSVVAAPSISTATSSSVELHDELKQSFSGAALSNLEHLGVTAYSTSDVEQTVIARALQDEGASRAKQKDKHTQQTHREAVAPSSSSSLKRKRIPKKTGVDFSSLSSVSLPPPLSVVHEDDPTTAAGTLAKQRLEDALNITCKTNKAIAPSNTRAYPPSSSSSSSFVDDDLPSARTHRQRLIETGEVTPFHSVAGVEKTYRRVNTNVKPTPPTTINTSRTKRETPSNKSKTKSTRSTTPTEQNRRKIAAQPDASKRKSKSPLPTTSRTPSPLSSTTSPVTFTSISPTSSPLSASELPARLTRAQIREQVNAIDAAVRREQGITEEEKGPEKDGKREYVELDDEDDEDLDEAAEQTIADVSAMPDVDADEEWKGDRESSGDDAEWNLNATRRSTGRRDLVKAEAEEVAEIEEEEEFVANDDEDDGDEENDAIDKYEEIGAASLSASRHRRRVVIIDDFLDDDYEERVSAYRESKLFANEIAHVEGREPLSADTTESESLDVAFDGGFVLPGRIWDRLFGYQKTSIKWLWELHCQNTGGIIADEMGLGKTIQIVAFLAGLHYSRALIRANASAASSSSSSSPSASSILSLPPCLILCPATIMTQWLREFHSWYPELRILVLHDSVQAHHGQSKEIVVDKLFHNADVLITTYECARLYRHLLLHREWGYVCLDEGHKIRNPDAAITLTCKQFLSIHRIILTGAPIQNNLIELWSLFDFVFPGKLGTLPVFEDEFCFPINQGGYVNASTMQVQLSYRCATVLRDLIHPYILRRSKADVAQHLPKKTEQVLFVSLSPEQRRVYKEYLASEEVQNTIDGRGSLFKAIHTLRKICNHPDLIHLKCQAEPKAYSNQVALLLEWTADCL